MVESNLEVKFYELLFAIRKSVRYHDYRRQFYVRIEKITLFFAFLLGTSTIAVFMAELSKDLPLWAKIAPSVFVTVLSGIVLIFQVSEKASKHGDLRRRFIELESDLEQKKHDPDLDKVVMEATQARLSIESEEPKVLRVLDSICHNQVLYAEGRPDKYEVPLNFMQRLFAQLFSIGSHKLLRRVDTSQ